MVAGSRLLTIVRGEVERPGEDLGAGLDQGLGDPKGPGPGLGAKEAGLDQAAGRRPDPGANPAPSRPAKAMLNPEARLAPNPEASPALSRGASLAPNQEASLDQHLRRSPAPDQDLVP